MLSWTIYILMYRELITMLLLHRFEGNKLVSIPISYVNGCSMKACFLIDNNKKYQDDWVCSLFFRIVCLSGGLVHIVGPKVFMF
jgi:hypothetical protein